MIINEKIMKHIKCSGCHYIKPFGPIFWCGVIIGFGIGGIFTTLIWVVK